jgi:putative addiction module component (TIGR02574 family)
MEGLGVGVRRMTFGRHPDAKLLVMNTRADLLLDEVLELPPEERSAVAMALLDSLEGSDQRVISEAWRAELLRRRDSLRSGAVKTAPWAEARARMTRW